MPADNIPPIRPYCPSDSSALIGLLNDCLTADASPDGVTLDFGLPGLSCLSDATDRGCHVCHAEGELAAAVWIDREVGARHIGHLYIRPKWRTQALARALLQIAFHHAQGFPEAAFDVSVTPGERFQREALTALGFRHVRTWWRMRVMLEDSRAVQWPPGLSIRSFRPGSDEVMLTQLVNQVFSDEWGEGVRSLQDMQETVGQAVFDPDLLLFLEDCGRVVGYSWSWIDQQKIALLGRSCAFISNLGVVASDRGRGLGRILLLHTLSQLRARGMTEAELDVDAPNVPARHLYASVGFVDIVEQQWHRRLLSVRCSL